jgi:quercetin dioxygenase-like cupin family protein
MPHERKTTVHEYDGFLLSLFQMNAGDKIGRHQHSHVHTTGVARGRSQVSIFHSDDHTEVFEMLPGYRDVPFPADVEHEIIAMEDDTIVVNLSSLAHHPSKGPSQPGGIAMEDGTVT